MIKGKNIKRGTVLVVASVIILTLVTMNVTYSAFFSVQTASNVQVISTGNLNITASANVPTAPTDGVMPSNEYSSINAANAKVNGTNFIKSTLTIKNEGNVSAQIGVSIKNTATGSNANLKNVIIAIQKNGSWIIFGDSTTYYTPISGLKAESGSGDAGLYPIIKDTIDANATNKNDGIKYEIYMWIAEGTEETEVDKALNYSVVVKAAPVAGQDNSNNVPSVGKTTS